MEEISKLATKHDLFDSLYPFPIISLIDSMMTYHMVEGYKNIVKKDYTTGVLTTRCTVF